MRQSTFIYKKAWKGTDTSILEQHKRERVINPVKVPEEFWGQKVAIYVVIHCENNYAHNRDWHFEGVSVTFN